MSDILQRILSVKRDEVAAARSRIPDARLRREAEASCAMTDWRLRPRGFEAALRSKMAQGSAAVIAEIKKASPSKGVLRPNLNPVELGGQYERAGASAISVLTDEKYFQGALADLTAVRRHVGVPCLRKEFIVDEYQVAESRALGADAIFDKACEYERAVDMLSELARGRSPPA